MERTRRDAHDGDVRPRPARVDAVNWLLNGGLHLLGTTITWREIVGNLLGFASAALALRRRVAAWPVGMVGNVLLFTIFLGGVFHTPQDRDLYGQAGRQVFFFAVSVYGWWRWRTDRDRVAQPVAPRWAVARERWALLALAVVGVVGFDLALRGLDSYQPLADAWILTGSLLATIGMARGWLEFWLVWIAVDAVGVPLLLRAQFYPSALLYGAYAVLCARGFVQWRRLATVPATSTREPAGSDVS